MLCCFFFFFNDTATTEIYTLSLHDALPISTVQNTCAMAITQTDPKISGAVTSAVASIASFGAVQATDRKSTRLNSSHSQISYAVFCLKKKKKKYIGS